MANNSTAKQMMQNMRLLKKQFEIPLIITTKHRQSFKSCRWVFIEIRLSLIYFKIISSLSSHLSQRQEKTNSSMNLTAINKAGSKCESKWKAHGWFIIFSSAIKSQGFPRSAELLCWSQCCQQVSKDMKIRPSVTGRLLIFSWKLFDYT